MRPSRECFRRARRSLCHGDNTTAALARQLLERHRRCHSTPADGDRFSPASRCDKTAVMASLAHAVDVREVDTRALAEATDKAWGAARAQDTTPVAPGAAVGRRALRGLRSTSSSLPPLERRGGSLSSFDAAVRRYAAVVPKCASCAPSDASRGWRVNLPISLTQRGTLQGVLAEKERLNRHREWQRIRTNHLLPRNGSAGCPMDDERRGSETTVRIAENRPFSSPLFSRHCLRFGSNTLQHVAFLTDPVMYYVLCNLHLTGDESMVEVRQRAEALSCCYNENTRAP